MTHSALQSNDALVPTEPIRTCVGCSQRSPRSELLRIAVDNGVCVSDPHAVRPGRGAWIHQNARCLDRARKNRVLRRALRLSEDVTPQLWAELERLIESQALPVPDVK